MLTPRGILAGFVAAVLGVGMFTVAAAPAQAAASPIQFGRIYYDSPGTDTRTNASLNAEYVIIRNTGTRAVSLTGWTLRDAQAHVYKFGTFTLGAGKSVVVRTGKGTNTTANRYWGQSNYIWNNTGDKAYLRTPSGALIDYCAWTVPGAGYKNC